MMELIVVFSLFFFNSSCSFLLYSCQITISLILSIRHDIDTGDNTPVYFKAEPLSREKLRAVEEEFMFLFNADIIHISHMRSLTMPTHCKNVFSKRDRLYTFPSC